MAENFILLLFLILPLVLFRAARRFFRNVAPRMRDRRIFTLVCGNLLVLLFLVSVLLLPGEIYFRFFYDQTDAFGLCKTTTRWFERHYHKNVAGFRDSINYIPVVEPGRRRVSFIGDSFTAGHGIREVEDRFANRVRALLPEREVHVLAECGWDTGMEMKLLYFLPTDGYELDLVVLVYCLNDVADVIPEWLEITERLYEGPPPGFFVAHSYLLNTLDARLTMSQEPAIADYYGFIRKGYEGAIWDRQVGRLQSFQQAVTDNGGQLCVVTFPFLHALSSDYEYRDLHQQLDAFWLDQQVPHLDLLDLFADRKPEEVVLSPRDAHPNEFAHSLAAPVIAEFIEAQLNQTN